MMGIFRNQSIQSTYKIIFLNAITGKYEPAPFLAPGVKAWTPDSKSLLYTTLDPQIKSAERDFVDENTKRKITLWRMGLDGTNRTALGTVVGYDVGTVAVNPDGSGAVLSVITSVPVDPFDPMQTVEPGVAHCELYYLTFSTGKAKRLAYGCQPAFGTGKFTALDGK